MFGGRAHAARPRNRQRNRRTADGQTKNTHRGLRALPPRTRSHLSTGYCRNLHCRLGSVRLHLLELEPGALVRSRSGISGIYRAGGVLLRDDSHLVTLMRPTAAHKLDYVGGRTGGRRRPPEGETLSFPMLRRCIWCGREDSNFHSG